MVCGCHNSSLARLAYGNLDKYGIHRLTGGPFELKVKLGRSPVIDVGTVGKIKQGKIKIEKDSIQFNNGDTKQFDALVFATGYQSTANNWLHAKIKDSGKVENSYLFGDYWAQIWIHVFSSGPYASLWVPIGIALHSSGGCINKSTIAISFVIKYDAM
ncbi:hypothetical protein C5167_037173 [Papaver somniferum]|uniref:Flavin-containing monooxygenase n=1 Tax=Papaver somniferum TaxID=3469 RepID=A0A4Y7I9A6_PAPSO|nr:hypothetical protein C5167_037173 [Papaver somniferum]